MHGHTNIKFVFTRQLLV